MPAKVRLELGENSYFVHIQHGGLADVLGPVVSAAVPTAQRALVVADAAVADRYGPSVRNALTAAGLAVHTATAPAGEASKTLAEAARLYEDCLDAKLERGSVIVAVGGGATGDLAGFVAATYLRGVAFIQVPTTLLAMVDASVGGKVAVNLPRGKNLVGAFHQPRAVVADPATLVSLSSREFRSGLAEVVKHGILRDRALFEYLEQHADAVLGQDPQTLEYVVERNVRIKGAVVSADEREGGLRAILNLGHTIGHGLEALNVGKLLHGECVSVGLVGAAWLAERCGLLAQPDLPQRLQVLLGRLGLPVRMPAGTDLQAVAAAMTLDKKAEGGQIKWVLPVRLGQVQVTRHVQAADINAVLQSLLEQ